MTPIIALLNLVLGIYGWVVFAYVTILLLNNFGILNLNHPGVVRVMNFLKDLVEPALTRIRRYVRPYKNIDFAPLVLLLAIYFVQNCLTYYFM